MRISLHLCMIIYVYTRAHVNAYICRLSRERSGSAGRNSVCVWGGCERERSAGRQSEADIGAMSAACQTFASLESARCKWRVSGSDINPPADSSEQWEIDEESSLHGVLPSSE